MYPNAKDLKEKATSKIPKKTDLKKHISSKKKRKKEKDLNATRITKNQRREKATPRKEKALHATRIKKQATRNFYMEKKKL